VGEEGGGKGGGGGGGEHVSMMVELHLAG